MINITKRAQIYLKKLLLSQDKNTNLRISIQLPGTRNAECKISYDKLSAIKNKDIVLKYDGFNIYIEKIIISYLRDAKIDLLGSPINQKLMLLAPHAINKIINNDNNFNSKKNSLFSEVQNFIDYNINPMLSIHGGKIILVKITKLGYVLIQFLGGCNGCEMSSVTLKKGIEKKILDHFKNLKGVQDITKHKRGVHSFL